MDVTFWVQLGAKVLILSCSSTGVVDFSIKVCLLKVAADDRRDLRWSNLSTDGLGR